LKSVIASKQFAAAALMTAVLTLGHQSRAGDLSLPVTGDLLGTVVNGSGIPQMGATVHLFNRYEDLIAKTMTGRSGRFAFTGLPEGRYSVRVSLASFLPAGRNNIAVHAGIDSMLEIHLATLFSDIEVHYRIPTAAMTEDWKWVLRASPATRLVTRYLPGDLANADRAELHPRVFSGTHAMVSISGSDTGLIDAGSLRGDMGTGFILSTNILGKNQLQVGGTYGQNGTFGPTSMGLSAIYSRTGRSGVAEPPEIALTVSQFGLYGGAPQATPMQPTAAVRVMSLSTYQVANPAGSVHLEYGVTGESVDFGNQHVSQASPFARATVSMGTAGEVVLAYSDGDRPEELLAHQRDARARAPETGAPVGDDLALVANALARMPQISSRNGNLRLQRTQSYEVGLSKTVGPRTYAVSMFHEAVWNGWMNVAGNLTAVQPNNLLSDGISQTAAYDIGRYRRNGLVASVNERAGDLLNFALAYGRMGGFVRNDGSLIAVLNGESGVLSQRNENLAAADIHAKLPKSGTQIWTSYGWVAKGAVVPRHLLVTQNTYLAPGFNIFVRQPLPAFFGIPARMELTADLRNLLAQGYLPLGVNSGNTVLIVQSPRIVRGGLNFVF
jgi:hypothetical protein